MTKPWIAFVLSLVLPGAGLAYAGKWLQGFVNFAVATALLLLILGVSGTSPVLRDHIHYVILIICTASAGYAHAIASGTEGRERNSTSK